MAKYKTKKSKAARRAVILTVTVLVCAGLGFAAYSYFNPTELPPQKSGNRKNEGATEIEHKTPSYNFSFKSNLKDGAGDCTLEMKDSSDVVVLNDKQKGKKGCGEWKLDISKLKPGEYELVETLQEKNAKKIATVKIKL